MNAKDRANILTISKNNSIFKMLNDLNYIKYFEDKAVFNEKFDKYLKREWLYFGENDFEKFAEFISDKDKIIAKPLDECCGRGIDIYHMKDYEPKALFDLLIANKAYLIEEVVEQDDVTNSMSPSSVNTIRIITIRNGEKVTLVAGCVRVSRSGNVVDNFNAGGLSGILDINTGKIVTDGYDKFRETFVTHPDTGTKFIGFEIPMWDEVVALVTEAAKVVPEVRYIGWDVAISKKYGPLLIEGNSYPGQDVTQYPKLNLGTYSVMMNAIE
jgi:glutathione synthase/RimK-type ligase-like ATP-grasp enzyme